MKWGVKIIAAALLGMYLTPTAHADASTGTFETPLLLSNECAVFYITEEAESGGDITRLEYGELVLFDARVSANTVLDISDTGKVNMKFHVQSHGSGIGQESGVHYQFNSNSMLKANLDGVDYDPFTGSYSLNARIIGAGQDMNGDGVAEGASNNAVLKFKARLHYANGMTTTEAFDFTIECAGSPWNNLMKNKVAGTKDEVGDGFRDPWNKYAWSMEDFDGGLYVGTKNMFYSLEGLLDAALDPACSAGPVPFPYNLFSCLELFGDIPDQVSSRGAEIWRLDYNNKRWERVFDAEDPTDVYPGEFASAPQGFRDMTVHQGKLYVASDLGAFISAVALDRTVPFTYPGVDLLVSEDGYTFTQVENCVDDLLCEQSAQAVPPAIPTNNGSIRALASVGDKLFIGTFNAAGGEVWSYDGTNFSRVFKAPLGIQIVAEINEYAGKLYVGVGGQLTTQTPGANNYVYACDLALTGCDETGDFAPPADLPNIDPGTVFVIKQFVAKDKLFVGTVNFDVGFSLLSYDKDDGWEIIVDGPGEGGFFNDSNAYLWSAAVVGDRIFVGTWNYIFFDQLPRGDGELWYSDDGVSWTEFALPLDWEFPNYGIRSMVYAHRQLFLGSASLGAVSNLDLPDGLRPATQIWSIRDTKANKPGNK